MIPRLAQHHDVAIMEERFRFGVAFFEKNPNPFNLPPGARLREMPRQRQGWGLSPDCVNLISFLHKDTSVTRYAVKNWFHAIKDETVIPIQR